MGSGEATGAQSDTTARSSSWLSHPSKHRDDQDSWTGQGAPDSSVFVAALPFFAGGAM